MRVLGAILLGCALLLPATSSAATEEEQQEISKRLEDIIDAIQNLAGNEDALDLRAAGDAETPGVAEGRENATLYGHVADDGLIMKKGCEDHQVGEEWGTPEHDNCYCEGPDRFCYHVDCLPGSEIAQDSGGLWDCPGGFSTDDSSEKQAQVDMLEGSLLQLLEGEESDALDLGVAGDAKTAVAAEEEDAFDLRGLNDGLVRKDGCGGHRAGDEWGSSDQDNCVCLGQDRICYDVDCLPGSEVARGPNGLWNCKVGSSKRVQAGEESDVLDLGVAGDAKTAVAAEEEDAFDLRGLDYGRLRKNGCEGHRAGDQWGSSNQDNCVCLGQDRICYDVDCLPGSEVARGPNGLWNCTVGAKTESAEVMTVKEKRITGIEAFGVFTGVVGLVGFLTGIQGAAQTTAQLNEIQGQIRALDRKVDDLTRSVSDLQLGQDYLQQVILYGRDEQRLKNILDTLARMQIRNGQYVGSDIQRWADSVLSHASDGIRQVLFNLLDMVQPQSSVFGGKSLFEIYHQQLKGDLERYTGKMPQKVAQVYGLIGGGYNAWIVALRIKGRSSEIAAKVQEGKQKLNSVKQNLEKYVTYGTCPSGYQVKSTKCYRAFNIRKTWPEAHAYCRGLGLGGNLAMPKDRNINDFLIQLKNARSTSWGFWFGLNDRASEGRWKWNDGTSLGSYNYWSPIEPNNGGKDWWGRYRGNEDCAEYFRKNWRNSNWNDADCNLQRYFICERAPNGFYRSLGCWKDTGNRAIPVLEGSDARLDGSYTARTNAIEKCYQVALSRGFPMFAVQHGGQCFGSANGLNTYNKYGPSTTCAADGEGGPWGNEVYMITGFYSLGCWKDTGNRAIPTLEGSDARLDGSYTARANAIEKCYQVALSRGFPVFAVQHGGWCAGSANALNTYRKYGPSTTCAADGEGGPWGNEVYMITG
ncbi:uncharacterized protein LOC144859496 [Branchiostoma floridae x Branchiostoma japonicum]